jgi:hypothetical protein
MKILVILCSHEMNVCNLPNIDVLNCYVKEIQKDHIVDYCCISGKDDFANYETILTFKYKIINPRKQHTKMCEFIGTHRDELNYDYYIKTRPDIKLLEQINLNILSDTAINARARVYIGPQTIKYGMSVNGPGVWKYIGDCSYDVCEKELILDDAFYIFHNNIIKQEAFKSFPYNDDVLEHEWFQALHWKECNIDLKIIGINLEFTKNHTFSGDLNM